MISDTQTGSDTEMLCLNESIVNAMNVDADTSITNKDINQYFVVIEEENGVSPTLDVQMVDFLGLTREVGAALREQLCSGGVITPYAGSQSHDVTLDKRVTCNQYITKEQGSSDNQYVLHNPENSGDLVIEQEHDHGNTINTDQLRD